MTFNVVVSISTYFMRGAKQKEMFEISDLTREILHLSICLFVHQFKPIPVISVGFCPCGLLSLWAFVQWAFVLVSFCPSGLLSSGLLS